METKSRGGFRVHKQGREPPAQVEIVKLKSSCELQLLRLRSSTPTVEIVSKNINVMIF